MAAPNDADYEGGRTLFRIRVRSRLRVWDYPHAVGRQVVPRVGTRIAELMETPIMLVVTILAARWIILRLSLPAMPFVRLGMGFIALVLMLVAEFGLVLWVRGISIKNYLATRDPVSGTA
jgi:hypothetical protein